MARVEKTVFISYRRKDISWALAVFQYLEGRDYDVFFDFSSLSSGDFEQVITSNIRARAHFLLILTPTALDRCNEPGDWLRREIETAVDEKRNIIPLFFDGFNFGSPSVAEKLTGKLAAITRYNGLDIPPGYFKEAMDRLSNRYLDVPLDAVIHPVPTEVRKVVKEEQSAANEALVQKWEEIRELIRPAKGSATSDRAADNGRSNRGLRSVGIGAGILAVTVAAGFALNAVLSNGLGNATPTATIPIVTNTTSLETSPPAQKTATAKVPTFTMTPEPTITVTSSPTPGIGSMMVSPKDGMNLLYVPAGEFPMGRDSGDGDEQPVHTVDLSAFWIDETEVTNQMYAACVQAGECIEPKDKTNYLKSEFELHPVVYVDWFDAQNYCDWAERRLPTEAEWEKAASWDAVNQIKRLYPWGNTLNCTFGNYFDTNLRCVGLTTAVKSYPKGKSPYGAYDMMGNVAEWVYDWYAIDYYSKLADVTRDPTGPVNGTVRVLRGGSWRSYNDDVSSSGRFRSDPAYRDSPSIGFRCAMDASK